MSVTVGVRLAVAVSVVVAEASALLRDAVVVRPPWCPDNLSFRMPDALVIRRRPYASQS